MSTTQKAEWVDVSLKNAWVLIEYLRAHPELDVSPELVFAALPPRLGRLHSKDELSEAWVTLDEWNAVLAAVLDRGATDEGRPCCGLGHRHHLRAAARWSHRVGFGFDVIQKMFVEWLLFLVTPPSVGLQVVPLGSKDFNDNKDTQVLHVGRVDALTTMASGNGNGQAVKSLLAQMLRPRDRVVLFNLVYKDGPQGESPRSTIADTLSEDWILGFYEGILELWRHRDYQLARKLVAQVPAIALLREELGSDVPVELHEFERPNFAAMAPEAAAQARRDWIQSVQDDYDAAAEDERSGTPNVVRPKRHGHLYIGDDPQPFGHVVYLLKNSVAGSQYIGDFKSVPGLDDDLDTLIPAILMTKNVETECARTHTMFPVLHAGTIYEHPETRLPSTTIAVPFQSSLVFQFLGWIVSPLVFLFTTSLRERERATLAVQGREQANRQRDIAEGYIRRTFPTQQIARRAELPATDSEAWQPRHFQSVVLTTDVVGYSRLLAAGGPGAVRTLTARMMPIQGQAVAASGGYVYKLEGDSMVAVWCAEWMRDEHTTAELVAVAVRVAQQIRDTVADELGVQLRIGISADTVPRGEWDGPADEWTMWDVITVEGEGGLKRFEATGFALVKAKRAETHAGDGCIAVTENAVRLLGDEPRSITVEHDKHGFPHHLWIIPPRQRGAS